MDYASAIGFISPLLETQNIKNCSFVLFDLNAAKMRFKVLEKVPFEGDKVRFCSVDNPNAPRPKINLSSATKKHFGWTIKCTSGASIIVIYGSSAKNLRVFGVKGI